MNGSARRALPILLWTLAGSSLFAQGYLSPLESNKKVVFDFYRLVFEPRNADLASQYLAEDFIEHNPRFQSGRDNFVKMLKSMPAPASDDIGDTLRNPPAMIVAEGDLVTYIFKRNTPDPKDKTIVLYCA